MATIASEHGKYQPIPATIEDAEGIVYCTRRSMADDPLTDYFWPVEKAHLSTDEERQKWRVARTREQLKKADGLAFKVVDPEDSSRVVGHAKWSRPGYFADHTIQRLSEESYEDASKGEEKAVPPAALDFDRQQAFMGQLDEARKEIWGDDNDFWYLALLCVDPDFQRRGIARRLLQFGIDRATEDQLPMYLEGTKAGLFVYEKMGFSRIRDVVSPKGECTLSMCVRPCDGTGKS